MRKIKFKLEKQIERAKLCLIERNDVKAIKLLSQILGMCPSNEEAWLYLGIAKRRIGEYDEAIECFKSATDLNKSLIEAWGLLTITLVDRGKINNAKEVLGKAARLNPYNATIQFLRDNLLRFYKQFGPFF